MKLFERKRFHAPERGWRYVGSRMPGAGASTAIYVCVVHFEDPSNREALPSVRAGASI